MKLTQILLIGILLLASVLRFYKIDTIPHGLYIDEVSIGYNAYTILTKGVDEHGAYYPLFFKAFGEYKMPVAVYLTSASMALFGKTEFAVRFPSALFGTLTVLLLYFFVKTIFSSVILASKRSERAQNPKPERFWHHPELIGIPQNDEVLALLSSFLLSITPWHIQFSRGGFEANIALFFYLLGVLLFLQFLKHKRFSLLVWSSLAFITTIYTYNAYKIITPIILIIVMFSFVIPNLFRNPQKILKQAQDDRRLFGMTRLILFCFSIFVLLLPVLLFSGGNNRFLEASAFSEYGNLSFLQKIITYPMIYLKNYLSYFSFPFLFVTGDGFGRHTVEGMGLLFRFTLPFLLVGFYALWKQRKEFFAKGMWFLLLVAPMAAALTLPSPHSLRSLLLVIPLTIITAHGFVLLWKQKSTWVKLVIVGIGMVAVYEFGLYLHLYYTHYPSRTALDWGGEYKQTIFEVQKLQKQYPHIVINSSVGMIQEYIHFYDDGLIYDFVGNNWEKPKEWENQKVLYIATDDKTKNTNLQTISHKHIRDIHFSNLNNDIFVQFWEI